MDWEKKPHLRAAGWDQAFLCDRLEEIAVDGSGLPQRYKCKPLKTARIQISNQNGLYKWFAAA
jgi:hypothetical protein